RLLVLPAFLREAFDPSPQDIADGFVLTGFFLARHVLEPRGLGFADARASFIAALEHDARRPSNEASGPGPLVARPAVRGSLPPAGMPVVPPPAVPLVVAAPGHLLDRLIA